MRRLEHCPCCLTFDKSDLTKSRCLRCGWKRGEPVVEKDLPQGFDDDFVDWAEQAYPTERAHGS